MSSHKLIQGGRIGLHTSFKHFVARFIGEPEPLDQPAADLLVGRVAVVPGEPSRRRWAASANGVMSMATPRLKEA